MKTQCHSLNMGFMARGNMLRAAKFLREGFYCCFVSTLSWTCVFRHWKSGPSFVLLLCTFILRRLRWRTSCLVLSVTFQGPVYLVKQSYLPFAGKRLEMNSVRRIAFAFKKTKKHRCFVRNQLKFSLGHDSNFGVISSYMVLTSPLWRTRLCCGTAPWN